MPSPNSITDLIFFVAGALVIVVGGMVGLQRTKWGRKFSGNWTPGPLDIKIEKPDPNNPRPKYIDPLAKFKPHYIILPAVGVMALLFVYYFLTKQTFQAGN